MELKYISFDRLKKWIQTREHQSRRYTHVT
ncbi:unnamed protein product, partial [Rotaria magnacalcarata]